MAGGHAFVLTRTRTALLILITVPTLAPMEHGLELSADIGGTTCAGRNFTGKGGHATLDIDCLAPDTAYTFTVNIRAGV